MGNNEFETDARTDGGDEISMSSSTNIGEMGDKKGGLSTGSGVDVSKKHLSHVLLAEKSRKAIKEEEEKLGSKGNDMELNEHKKQLENALLAHYQTTFAESQINRFDLERVVYREIRDFGFEDIEEFKKSVVSPEFQEQYISTCETREDIESAMNSLFETYEKCIALESLDEKIKFLNGKIKEVKKDIENLFKKGNRLQKDADNISERILDLISSGALEQRLYLGNEAHLKDSVLGGNIDTQLKNIIDMYKNKEYVESHGLKLPKTILLFGDVNSGKSFAAKVLATEIGRDMYTINKQDICGGTFGDDPINALKGIFLTIAEKEKPCIIFLDEIDKILDIYKRSPYNEIVGNAILSHMLYVKDSDLDIITIGGITNKNNVDEDFLKYDNFGTQIFLPELDDDNRFKYFEILKEKYGSKNVEFADMKKDYIINMLSSYSKDVIKKLVDMAVESAVTRNIGSGGEKVMVEQSDFDRASSILKESEKAKTKKYL